MSLPQAGLRQPTGRGPLIALALIAGLAGLYWFQAHPRFWPIPEQGNAKAIDATFSQLSKDDPATPDQDGSDLELGERLSDYALFSAWFGSGRTGPHQFTVGGAIDYQRPISVRRIAQEAADQQAAIKAEAQQRAADRALAAQQAAEKSESDQREAAAIAIANAQGEREAPAVAATVACNLARAHAYGTARNEAEYLSWVQSHPCQRSTDARQ